MIYANTTASFGRGSTTNAWGDDLEDANAPVYATGVKVAITTQTRMVANPESGEARTVVNYVGRVDPRIGVKVGDQLRDEKTQATYLIDDVAYANSSIGFLSCTLALRQV